MPKDKIRKEILAKLKNQNEHERIEKSLIIKEKLFKSAEFKHAKVIMFYVSKSYEVNTHDMIDEAILMGKIVVVPKTIKNKEMLSIYEISSRSELKAGNMGIMEPHETCSESCVEKIDMVVVPGIAFDKSGHRIGHGKGYYDRFLKDVHEKTHIIGVSFSFQIVDKIPTNTTDFPVEKIISE